MSDDTATLEATPSPDIEIEEIDKVIIRFAGDSGDGMQLAGTRFTADSAIFGNDLATLPNFPAEIRAPAGTIPGVSSFQVQIADFDILTPGDEADVLVAMNPAALKANLIDLRPGGMIIANEEAFEERNLAKAGFDTNPLEDGSLAGYRVFRVPMERLTKEAVKDTGVTGRDILRSKNFFALGLISWVFHRPLETSIKWVESKFAKREEIAAANIASLRAGHNFGLTTEAFHHVYNIKPASLAPGEYTNVTGNTATAWGLIAASQAAKLPLFYGTYPITPASDILHELARHKNFGVRTYQAEDEIAGVGAAVGAAFAGHLAVTGTSGPGLALKSETISLAISLELPLVVIDVQRAGPSTGLPTKVEQSDLLFSLYGRHGEAPLPVLAARTASDAFDVAVESARIALKYMTPVIMLSDNYIANGSEPWQLPDLDALPDISVPFQTEPNANGHYLPYLRDPETLARQWAIPGTPGLEHRLGGLEKREVVGNVSYDTNNHQLMTELREWKIRNIANDIPLLEVDEGEGTDLLVLGWGSTYGAIRAAAKRVRKDGQAVATAHLRYLNPFPSNLGEVLGQYRYVLIPEVNMGQLRRMIRAEFLVPAMGFNKVKGLPFRVSEVENKIREILAS
ncbi:MAG: 2-oxoacid:acceptor oxidoreductase subunit alpha [Acidimicrobiia bacterium]